MTKLVRKMEPRKMSFDHVMILPCRRRGVAGAPLNLELHHRCVAVLHHAFIQDAGRCEVVDGEVRYLWQLAVHQCEVGGEGLQLRNMEDRVDLAFWRQVELVRERTDLLDYLVGAKVLEGELGARVVDHRALSVRLKLEQHLFTRLKVTLGAVAVGVLLEPALGAFQLGANLRSVRRPVHLLVGRR